MNDLKTNLAEEYEKMRQDMINDILTNRFADNVNKPAHYQGKIECIDAIEAAVEGLEGLEAVCTANVIKYVWRWKKKNGIEDCYKAKWYLNKLIDEIIKSKCSEYEQKQFGLD